MDNLDHEHIIERFSEGDSSVDGIVPVYGRLSFEIEDDRLKIRGDKDPYIKDVFYTVSTSFDGKEFNKKSIYKFAELPDYITNDGIKYKYASDYVQKPTDYVARYGFLVNVYSIDDPSVTGGPFTMWLKAKLYDKEYLSLMNDHASQSDEDAKKVKKTISISNYY